MPGLTTHMNEHYSSSGFWSEDDDGLTYDQLDQVLLFFPFFLS